MGRPQTGRTRRVYIRDETASALDAVRDCSRNQAADELLTRHVASLLPHGERDSRFERDLGEATRCLWHVPGPSAHTIHAARHVPELGLVLLDIDGDGLYAFEETDARRWLEGGGTDLEVLLRDLDAVTSRPVAVELWCLGEWRVQEAPGAPVLDDDEVRAVGLYGSPDWSASLEVRAPDEDDVLEAMDSLGVPWEHYVSDGPEVEVEGEHGRPLHPRLKRQLVQLFGDRLRWS